MAKAGTSSDEDVKGVPDFWLSACGRHDAFGGDHRGERCGRSQVFDGRAVY